MAITFNHNDQVYVKDGKMGIGASDPLRDLHVVGNFAVNAGTDEYYGVYIPGHAEGSDPQILIGDWHNASATITWDSSARALNIDTQYSSGAGTFNITGNDGASTFLTVNTSGNVGIGTTNPAGKLHVDGGRSYFTPSGDSDSGTNSHVIDIYNANDTAFTTDALAAYNNHTSWDIGSKSTYTISSRTKQGSIYTFAGEHASAAVAINRYVQLNSDNDNPLLNWTFYQWDGAGTAATDLKVPNKVWTVQTYQSGGSDTLLILNGDGTLQLSQYGAGVLTTDSAGNVGVSTGYITQSTADGRYVNVTGDTMTDQLVIQKTGNFTAAKFKGTAADGYGQINVENDLGTALILGSMGSTKTGTFFDNARYIGATSGELVLKTYSSTDGHMKFLSGGQNERMRITAGGNVGIGTTSPDEKLDVSDGNAQMLFGAASSDRSWLQFKHNAVPADGEELGLLDFRGYNDASEDTRYVILTAKAEDVTDGSEDGSLTFQTIADGTATQTLTMRSGNVGIGTTGPLQKLDVSGVAYFRGGTAADFGSGNTPTDTALVIDEGDFIYTKDNTYLRRLIGKTTGDIIQIGESGTSLIDGIELKPGSGGSGRYIAFFDNNTESARFTGGNLGIGTTSPSEKLHVVGDVILGEHRIIDLPSFNMGGSSVTDEYLVVCKQAPSGGGVNASGIQGRISFSRGSSGSFNNSQYIDINIQMSLDSGNVNNLDVTQFELYRDGSNAFFSQLEEIDIDGTKYVALKARSSGGGETNHFYFEGSISDASDTNILSRVRASDSTVTVTDPQPTGFPITPYITKNQDGDIGIGTGNVGIGTTSPTNKLNVVGGAGNDIIAKFKSTGTGVSDYTEIHIENNGSDKLVMGSIGSNFTSADWTGARYIYSTAGKLYLKAKTDLQFFSGGTSVASHLRMTIASDGNVGIGTTNPGIELDVAGGIRATAGTANGLRVHTNSGITASSNYMNFFTSQSNGWAFNANGTGADSDTKVVITAGGNVIIGGTSAPSTTWTGVGKLAAVSDLYVGVNYTTANDTNGNYTILGLGKSRGTLASPTAVADGETVSRVIFYGHDGTDYRFRAGISAIVNGTVSSGVVPLDMTFETGSSGATERMRITSGGNVGIGLTDPAAKLEVLSSHQVRSAANAGHKLRIEARDDYYNDTSSAGMWISDGGNTGPFSGQGSHFIIEGRKNSARHIYFKVGDTTSPQHIMSANGNVGIGTTSPAFTSGSGLEIQRSGTATLRLDSGNLATELRAYTDGTFLGQLSASYLDLGTNNTARVRIDSSGNVGIGTTSPSTSLHVVKDASWEVARFEADSYPTATVYSQAAAKYAQLNIYDTRINSEPTMELRADTPHFNIRLDDTGNVLTIRDGGNVGIGTTSPGAKLDVAGTSRSDLHIFRSNQSAPTADAFIFRPADNTVALGTANTERVRIDSSGNVGIGTTSPVSELQVNGDIALANNGVIGQGSIYGNTGNSSFSTLKLYDASTGHTVLNNQSYDIKFNTAGGTKMVIQNAGNIGIGTTSPAEKLQVEGNIKLPSTSGNGLFFVSGSAPSGLSWYSQPGTSDGPQLISYGSAHVIIDSDNNDADTRFFTIRKNGTNYANSTELLRVTESGNVGIGTTAPQQALHIKGATNGLMMLEGDNDNGIAGCYYKTEDTDDTMNRTKGFFGFQGNNGWGLGYFTMWLDTVGDNGQVTSSEEKFRWQRDGDFHADGDVIAYSTTTPSDIRLKTDVETIESASEKVSKLRGVEYTWSKGKLAGQREIGLIAQEVEAVVPEVVKEKELPLWDGSGESYKTVDYEKLVALLIESNKEMQEEIKQLKERLDGFTK